MKTKKYLRALSCVILCMSLMSASGCKEDTARPESTADQKPIIAVTIVPQETFVKAVCKDLVEIVTMVPPGNSPENYEPSPELMEKFSRASLYFAIGVPTEEANILPGAGKIKTVSLQDEAAAVYPEITFGDGERDPHIWLSPKRVMIMVEAIAREMGGLDPSNKEIYKENAEEYIAELVALDNKIEAIMANVRNKKFIVFHPAFGYFADDYDLEMFALEEEGKEATAKHLAEMIDLAKAENIKVIFYQEEIDSSQSEAYAEEISGATMQLSPLAADYIENLRAMANLMAEVMQ